MVFDKKAELLALTETFPGLFEWTATGSLWVNFERTVKTNLFSKVGIGARNIEFRLRKQSGITLHNALRVDGRFYFLTAITEVDQVIMLVSAADIQPVDCALIRNTEREGPNKSSVEELVEAFRYPGILTEKYLRFAQEEPMARTETMMVLVTPKPILMDSGDLVAIGEPPGEGDEDFRIRYAVQVCHMLDEYKNEYEIYRKDDT